jgi:hypothetical protein
MSIASKIETRVRSILFNLFAQQAGGAVGPRSNPRMLAGEFLRILSPPAEGGACIRGGDGFTSRRRRFTCRVGMSVVRLAENAPGAAGEGCVVRRSDHTCDADFARRPRVAARMPGLAAGNA